MEKLSKDVPKKKVVKEADALRSYIYARRHFGGSGLPGRGVAGRGVAGRGGTSPNVSRRVSAPTVPVSMSRAVSSHGPGATSPSSSRQAERAREMLSAGVASQFKTENLQEESPKMIIHIIRLMLSCLHAWRLDDALDHSCEEVLGLVRPSKPVSFGLLSKGGCMSLVLPGWGLRTRLNRTDPSHLHTPTVAEKESSEVELSIDSPAGGVANTELPPVKYTFDQKYHLRWQLSRALTTQHLLTMVSITHTLMNQTVGVHQLANSSSSALSSDHDEDSDSEGEDHTVWHNQIKAVWSRASQTHSLLVIVVL